MRRDCAFVRHTGHRTRVVRDRPCGCGPNLVAWALRAAWHQNSATVTTGAIFAVWIVAITGAYSRLSVGIIFAIASSVALLILGNFRDKSMGLFVGGWSCFRLAPSS